MRTTTTAIQLFVESYKSPLIRYSCSPRMRSILEAKGESVRRTKEKYKKIENWNTPNICYFEIISILFCTNRYAKSQAFYASNNIRRNVIAESFLSRARVIRSRNGMLS